jgi:hypothetical protein
MSRSSSKPRVSCASKTAGDGPTGTEAAQLSTAPRAHLTVAERAARGRAMRSEVDAARTPPAGSRPPIAPTRSNCSSSRRRTGWQGWCRCPALRRREPPDRDAAPRPRGPRRAPLARKRARGDPRAHDRRRLTVCHSRGRRGAAQRPPPCREGVEILPIQATKMTSEQGFLGWSGSPRSCKSVSMGAARRRNASRVPPMCPLCVRVFFVPTTQHAHLQVFLDECPPSL